MPESIWRRTRLRKVSSSIAPVLVNGVTRAVKAPRNCRLAGISGAPLGGSGVRGCGLGRRALGGEDGVEDVVEGVEPGRARLGEEPVRGGQGAGRIGRAVARGEAHLQALARCV